MTLSPQASGWSSAQAREIHRRLSLEDSALVVYFGFILFFFSAPHYFSSVLLIFMHIAPLMWILWIHFESINIKAFAGHFVFSFVCLVFFVFVSLFAFSPLLTSSACPLEVAK